MHHDAVMRTTIDINDATLLELRKRAAKTGRPFREVVEQSLKLGLAQMDKPAGRKRIRILTHPLALKPGFQGVSLNQLYDQLEAEKDISRRA
jgi:hypothetical protein